MPIWLKVLIVAAAIGALFAAKGAYDDAHYQAGWNARDQTAKADSARIEAAGALKLAGQTAAAAAAERALRDQLNAKESQRLQEKADHDKRQAALLARVRVGDERLSIPTAGRSVPGCPTAQNPGAAGGPGAETRTDLLPGTAERIFSIAGRSAVDVRDYNAIVDAYNAARATCNDALTPAQ